MTLFKVLATADQREKSKAYMDTIAIPRDKKDTYAIQYKNLAIPSHAAQLNMIWIYFLFLPLRHSTENQLI